MRPAGAQTAHPQVHLWLATWRHSRVGWMGLGVLAAMTSAAVIAVALGRGQVGASGVKPPLAAVWLFAGFFSGIAFLAGALLSAAWVRLHRGGAFRMQPGSEQAAQRLAVTQACSVWLLATLALAALWVAQVRMSTGVIAWSALAALGLPALAVAMGIAAPVFGRTVMWIIQIGVALPLIVLPTAVRQPWFSLSERALDAAAIVLGIVGPLVLAVVLTLTCRQLFGAGASGARPLDLVGLLERGSGTPATPRGIDGLWLSASPATIKSGISRLLAWCFFLGLMLLTISPSTFPWNGQTAGLIAMVGSFVWLGSSAGAWASPRLAMVPGGWQRAHSSWPALLRRMNPLFSNREFLAVSLALLLWVAASWQPTWQQWVALALGMATLVLIMAASTLALLPTGLSPTSRLVVVLGADIVLAGCLSLMSHSDWPLADEHPSSWLARSAVLLAGAIVLGWVMLVASRRAWERIDWGRQPALPPFLTHQPPR